MPTVDRTDRRWKADAFWRGSAATRDYLAAHTAGVPGRHEIDESQELFYPAVMKAIADTGFTGYIAHEYSPTKDPLGTLEKMLRICEV